MGIITAQLNRGVHLKPRDCPYRGLLYMW